MVHLIKVMGKREQRDRLRVNDRWMIDDETGLEVVAFRSNWQCAIRGARLVTKFGKESHSQGHFYQSFQACCS